MKCKIEVEGLFGKVNAELNIDFETDIARSIMDDLIGNVLDAAGVMDEKKETEDQP